MSSFRCDESTIVSTKAGKLQGYFFNGVYVFKGVHYAEADRYMQPKEVEPWEGIVDATSYGKVAWHCSDIPFVFKNIERVPSANVEGVSERLQDQVFAAVMAFARTGNPNNDKLPLWDASKENDEATMVFDKECECRHNFDHKLVPMGREAFFKYGQFGFGNIQH